MQCPYCSAFYLPHTPQPPIVPKVSYEGDTRNFDDYPENNWRSTQGVSDIELAIFSDF